MSPVVTLIKKWRNAIFENPVFLKELRIGLREKKVLIIQSIYLLVLGVVVFIFLMSVAESRNYYSFREAGENFFLGIYSSRMSKKQPLLLSPINEKISFLS